MVWARDKFQNLTTKVLHKLVPNWPSQDIPSKLGAPRKVVVDIVDSVTRILWDAKNKPTAL